MKKMTILPVLAFLVVCGMGLFTAMAAGISWGTAGAGIISGMTFFSGSVVFGITLFIVTYPESHQ